LPESRQYYDAMAAFLLRVRVSTLIWILVVIFPPVPEPPTRAMMILGFTHPFARGLVVAGCDLVG
jgi:hypothetical protein